MASSGEAEVNGILKHDADKGVPVHSFDPSAPPREKGAAAGKGQDKLKSVNESAGAGEKELPVQQGGSNVAPTIQVEDTDSGPSKLVASGTDQVVEEVQTDSAIPGAMPSKPAPAIPDWYRVGWRQTSGIDKPPLPEGEEKDKGVLDIFLSEQFYGAWYHNAGLIVFAVIVSHFLTRFNFGWGWLFIILAFCNTYYSTSLERVRRRARDDIQRELVKTRLASEHESADWINNFLDRFWLIYEPVLSATVVSSVDQILSTNKPAFLDSLRLSQFTLGTKAPRIDKVRTFPKTDEDVIMMDWGISFTPNDVSDLTPRQLARKVNPKIVLSVRLGKGLATASMPILLEDISFSGLMRIRMKLMSNFPHVQIVDFCFLEKPVIDYVLKPVGGETFGFDIANVPGLSTFVREMTHATLGPMMYDPNVFTLNLEQMLSGKPLDAAIGVIQVTVHSARGIKGTKIGGGTPDPYIALTINDRAELARTKTIPDTYNPTWIETRFVLINSLQESLIFNLWDYNEHRKDSHMGAASFELSKLLDDAVLEEVHSKILKDGKERGEVRYDISYYPVLEPEEGHEVTDTSVGIVRLTLHQAKELDASKSLNGDLNPQAKVFLGNTKSAVYSTRASKHTNAPVWESPYEFLCTDKATSVVMVKVIDDRDIFKDPDIGYMSIKLTDLLDSMGEAGRDWFPLSGCKSGKIRLSAEWKPLSMAGSLSGADQYQPPIGVVRLLLDRASDVKNVEATLGGKSDPYVRVLVNNVTKARTEVRNNNLNPVWDEIVYIPVPSLRESILLECMDYQHLTRDRSLGSVELDLASLAKESTDRRYPFESLGRKDITAPIRLDNGNAYKGHLHYKAEFIPALSLRGISFDGTGQGSTNTDKANGRSGTPSDRAAFETTIKSSTRSTSPKRALTNPTTSKTPSPPPAEAGEAKKDVVDAALVAKEGEGKRDSVVATPEPKEGEGKRDSVGTTPEPKDEPKGVDMPIEELLKQQSGIIVFNAVSGHLARKARLEVLLDDGYWPCFSSPKARSTNAQWNYVGEGFIKEVDFSRVWLRLNQGSEGEKDDIIAQWKGDAKPFLESTLTGVQTFTLVDEDDRNSSTVNIEARYIPVPVALEPRETINNQGILRVDLIDGDKIHAADRGGKIALDFVNACLMNFDPGKSDPFAVFTLNGQKVFKSQTVKKTLSPEWNENFDVQVPSRVASQFEVELFDWNQIEQAKSLGSATIDLNDFEPFEAVERTLNLSSAKLGNKGHLRIRMLFRPEIIVRSRKNTSTFSTAGRAMTTIGGLPVSAGKGVFHGVTGVFKRDKDTHAPEVRDMAASSGQASQPAGLSDNLEVKGAAFPTADGGAEPQEPGTLRVTVQSAKDIASHDSKAYVTIRVGDKEFKTKHVGKTATPEWNETFTFTAGPHTPKLFAWIHDHKTLGKDKDLGEGEVDIWRHVKTQGVSSADVFLELREGGFLRLRLEFDATLHPNGSSASISSGERAPRSISIASPSRFSIGKRRHAEES
ncbi:hypothetical protein DXG03_006194 [Asterophora parasitica]|uniref:Tricalbin n=1 Tax=Asterophora parasitica TaxID=117018 RepID=A0A9P7KDN9_9AGAR|nr:hypothetical protein DXG03_006194 [Asterophora parasitica]